MAKQQHGASGAIGTVARQAEGAAESAPVRMLGRVGLLAYGGVHLVVAGLMAQVALGDRERADKKGALHAIAETAVGVVLLWVVVVGLAALVLWQLAEAVWGHRGTTGRRRAARVAVNLGEAVVFGVLAHSAWKIASAKGGDSFSGTIVAGLFALPGGPFLVGLVGVAILAAAAYAVQRGVRTTFRRDLALPGGAVRRWAILTGRVGWVALGAAGATVGVLLVLVAARFDPAQPVGLDAGIQTLAAQPYGPVLLLLLALGLAVFAAHCAFDARYRKA